jgi:hypothetical protein
MSYTRRNGLAVAGRLAPGRTGRFGLVNYRHKWFVGHTNGARLLESGRFFITATSRTSCPAPCLEYTGEM